MLERKISGYLAEFSCHEHQLLINITHPNKQIMLFGRFTNDIFPDALREIADNIFELHEIIKETPDDKLQVTHNHELVIAISIGKRSKEYAIPLEKADLSKEDSLSKKVEDLQKQLERMTFEATFYK